MESVHVSEAAPARPGKRAQTSAAKKEAAAKVTKRQRDDELDEPSTAEASPDEAEQPTGSAVSQPAAAEAKSPPRSIAAASPVANNGSDAATADAPAPLAPPAAAAVTKQGAPGPSPHSDRMAAVAALGLLGLVDAAAVAAKEEGLAPPPVGTTPGRTPIQIGTLGDKKTVSTPFTGLSSSGSQLGRPTTGLASQLKMQVMAANARTTSMPLLAAATGNQPAAAALAIVATNAAKSAGSAPVDYEVSTSALMAASAMSPTGSRPPASRSLSVPTVSTKRDRQHSSDDKQPSKRSMILMEKKQQGLCTAPGCDSKAEGGFRRCTACRNHDRERQRRLRSEAMGQTPGQPHTMAMGSPMGGAAPSTATSPAASTPSTHHAAVQHTAGQQHAAAHHPGIQHTATWTGTSVSVTSNSAQSSVSSGMGPLGGAGVTVK